MRDINITIQILKRVTLLYVFFSFPNVEITDQATWFTYKMKLTKDDP